MDVSLSVRVSAGNVKHNNRDFIAYNVDPKMTAENIVYARENLREVYDKLFTAAQIEHDQKQSRNREKYGDYYDHIANSKQEKLFYEAIVQFGDKDDMGVKTAGGKIAKQMLGEYMKDFQNRNPHLYVFNATLHLDESTPHLHIDFVPFATNQTRGMNTRVSLKEALRQQNFFCKNQMFTERQQWAAGEKKIMAKIAARYGIDIKKQKKVRRQYLYVDEYKTIKDEIKTLNKKMKSALAKPAPELTREEIDFLRIELAAKKEQLRTLEEQNDELSGGKLQKFHITDEQKLSYIVEKLTSQGIDVTEETQGFTVAVVHADTAREIEKAYKPAPISWREKLKLDIDRSIYTVKNLDELLEKLRERGYEVKRGKYIAVKPKGAERFIRTRSLGADYTEQALEKRVQNNRKYEKTNAENIAKSSGIVREFFTVTGKVIVLFYAEKKYPSRHDPQKAWAITNDKHVTELVNCAKVLNERGITSGAILKQRVDNLREKIESKRERITELDKLKTDTDELEKQAEILWGSAAKSKSMPEARKAAAREILSEYGVTSPQELPAIADARAKTESEYASVKDELTASERELAEYGGLLDLYAQVEDGSYLNHLIRLETERAAREEKERTEEKKL